MRKINIPRYEHDVLAWEHDQRMPNPCPGELEWYLKYARKSGDPILELACGSGRLLIPIAEAGYRIDGVDRAYAMLCRLKNRLTGVSAQTKERIRVFRQDILEFCIDCQYSMVFIAMNSLQYLEEKNKIADCFRRAHDFLKPGGYFLAMVQRIDLSHFADGKRLIVDWMDKPIVDDRKCISVGSRFVSYLEPDGKRIIKERTYKIVDGQGKTETIECVTFTPIIQVDEYVRMLKEPGFDVQVFSGYDEHPEDKVSKEICFACRKGNTNDLNPLLQSTATAPSWLVAES